MPVHLHTIAEELHVSPCSALLRWMLLAFAMMAFMLVTLVCWIFREHASVVPIIALVYGGQIVACKSVWVGWAFPNLLSPVQCAGLWGVYLACSVGNMFLFFSRADNAMKGGVFWSVDYVMTMACFGFLYWKKNRQTATVDAHAHGDEGDNPPGVAPKPACNGGTAAGGQVAGRVAGAGGKDGGGAGSQGTKCVDGGEGSGNGSEGEGTGDGSGDIDVSSSATFWIANPAVTYDIEEHVERDLAPSHGRSSWMLMGYAIMILVNRSVLVLERTTRAVPVYLFLLGLPPGLAALWVDMGKTKQGCMSYMGVYYEAVVFGVIFCSYIVGVPNDLSTVSVSPAARSIMLSVWTSFIVFVISATVVPRMLDRNSVGARHPHARFGYVAVLYFITDTYQLVLFLQNDASILETATLLGVHQVGSTLRNLVFHKWVGTVIRRAVAERSRWWSVHVENAKHVVSPYLDEEAHGVYLLRAVCNASEIQGATIVPFLVLLEYIILGGEREAGIAHCVLACYDESNTPRLAVFGVIVLCRLLMMQVETCILARLYTKGVQPSEAHRATLAWVERNALMITLTVPIMSVYIMSNLYLQRHGET